MVMQRLREATSGKFIGDPALRAGPGSIGPAWRANGATTPTAMNTTYTPLPNLDAIAVDMQPGYYYELDVGFPVLLPATATANVSFSNYYRVRNASTNVWGNWTLIGTGTHTITRVATSGASYCCRDLQFGVTVTENANAIAFAAYADNPDASIVCNQSYAKVSEYL